MGACEIPTPRQAGFANAYGAIVKSWRNQPRGTGGVDHFLSFNVAGMRAHNGAITLMQIWFFVPAPLACGCAAVRWVERTSRVLQHERKDMCTRLPTSQADKSGHDAPEPSMDAVRQQMQPRRPCRSPSEARFALSAAPNGRSFHA